MALALREIDSPMENRRSSPPYFVLVLAWLAFAAYVWLTANQLPAMVATHFGAEGEPNGYQTHAGYLRFTLIFGAAVPAFVTATFLVTRLGNGWGLNISNKDYWLAPERREQTFAFVQRHGIWFALLLMVFFAGIHYTILDANARNPASLPPSFLYGIVGPFLGATLVWVAILVRHFRKPA